ncbi:MAG: hypothetical protein M0Z33_08355 [Actinomycetota bacterium]|nr:hypothetical protein [Actinomycetota bacterium]
MHPIERLRYVARDGGAEPELLAVEAASALAAVARDPRALVTSAKRLVELHLGCAPLVWVAARVLASLDPEQEAREAAAAIEEDATLEELAAALPGGATVVADASRVVLGSLARRGDVTARVVRTDLRSPGLGGSARGKVTSWRADEVADAASGAVVAVVEVVAAGPDGCVLDPAALAVAREAAARSLPLWAVAGVGHVLPGPLFEALAQRLPAASRLPVAALGRVVGPDGPTEPSVALARPGCPSPPELAR